MRLKLIPVVFFFVIIFSSVGSGYSVDPVWEHFVYHKGEIAQFELFGDKNQTNITAKLTYYYQADPTNKSAVRFFSKSKPPFVPTLDENGTGIFEFRLSESNGIREHGDNHQGLGFYNLTFIFGYDVIEITDEINGTGIQTYEAPRYYIIFEVKMSDIDMLLGNAMNNEALGNTVNSGVNKVVRIASDVWLVVIISLSLFGLFVFNWLWEKKYYETFITSFLKIVKATWKKYRSSTGDLDDLLNPATSIDRFRRLWRNLDGQIGVNERALRETLVKADRLDAKLDVWRSDEEFLRRAILTSNPKDPHLTSPIIIFRAKDGTVDRIKYGEVRQYKKLKDIKTETKKTRKGVING